MKEWRPKEGWKNLYTVAFECTRGSDIQLALQYGMQGLAYENGADAMLGALRKRGGWLNGGQTLCDLNNMAIIPYKSKGGHIVFIPGGKSE